VIFDIIMAYDNSKREVINMKHNYYYRRPTDKYKNAKKANLKGVPMFEKTKTAIKTVMPLYFTIEKKYLEEVIYTSGNPDEFFTNGTLDIAKLNKQFGTSNYRIHPMFDLYGISKETGGTVYRIVFKNGNTIWRRELVSKVNVNLELNKPYSFKIFTQVFTDIDTNEVRLNLKTYSLKPKTEKYVKLEEKYIRLSKWYNKIMPENTRSKVRAILTKDVETANDRLATKKRKDLLCENMYVY
jgi:hypothetical protein